MINSKKKQDLRNRLREAPTVNLSKGAKDSSSDTVGHIGDISEANKGSEDRPNEPQRNQETQKTNPDTNTSNNSGRSSGNSTNSDGDNKSRKWNIVIDIAVLLLIAGCVISSIYIFDRNKDEREIFEEEPIREGPDEEWCDSIDYEREGPSYSESTDSVDRVYNFILDGDFYGYIGDEYIKGNLTLDTDVPHGFVYNDFEGISYQLEGSPSGRVWSQIEYDPDTEEYIMIATWVFDYWDLGSDCFANGRFVREWDGYTLPISLYKYNNY